jgi:hypothetical protein
VSFGADLTAGVANGLWWASAASGHRRFRRALDDPAAAQARLLRGYLAAHADTAFGRRHGFAGIDSPRRYQQRVPRVTYDEHRPWIERVLRGEPRVLTGEPVERLVVTSGSTAAAKWLPWTAGLGRELRRAVGPWISDLFRRRPALALGPAYWSVTPAPAPPRRPPGADPSLPLGFDEDSGHLGRFHRRLIGAALAVPAEVRHLGDLEAFRHVTLLFLLRARELRLISVWHPSYLTLLLEDLERRWPALLADLAAGTVTPPGGLPEALAARWAPAPGRAAELDRIGPGDLHRVWPRLGLVSCWGDAHAALHLPEVSRLLPRAAVQPKGLLATEACVTVPFGGLRPLAVRSHFFEFLPAGSNEPPRLAHELERDAVYSVVVTTGGGLYRYRLEDRVEVEGFLGRTPCLRFLGKEDHVADRRGEKVSEGFAGAVLARLLERFRLAPRFALLAPEETSPGIAYTLFLELPAGDAADLSQGLAAALEGALEEELRENPHYRACAVLGQLAPARLFLIASGGYAAYARHRGQRLGDVKPTPLSPETGWSQVFTGAFVGSGAPHFAGVAPAHGGGRHG